MLPWLINHSPLLRLAIFIIALALFSFWESAFPFRAWGMRWQQKWQHLALGCISLVLIKLLFPALAIGIAVKVQHQQLGALHQSHLAIWWQVLFGVLILDFLWYLQHRLFHKIPWLWRVHRVHHMDLHLDASTALRFHPIEEILSMAVKCLAIVFFGITPWAVLIFEILLGFALLFAHLNVRLSFKAEKWLRLICITPGLHRIHHSDYVFETNSNYGFCFSWWDKLFGSYVPYSQSGDRKLVLGLEGYRDPKYQRLLNMLLIPFNIKRLKVWPRKAKKVKFAP